MSLTMALKVRSDKHWAHCYFVKEERLLGLVDTRQRRQNLDSRFIHPDRVAEFIKCTKLPREPARENTIVAGLLMPLCGALIATGIQTFWWAVGIFFFY
jgi:hypothetical protein